MEINLTVNGATRRLTRTAGRSLLEVLREDLGITGPKPGCGEGACGACTVLLGQLPVTACTTPATAAAGQRVTTVEGLAADGVAHPVQQAWLETGAMQCGYCTAGFLVATAALLAEVPHPSDAQVDAALAGHVCRCCTYPRIRRAVRRAAELTDHPDLLVPVPDAGPAWPAVPGAPGGAGARPGGVPAGPWDLAGDGAQFFDLLGDGLVAVTDEPAGAGWATTTRAWVHVGADGITTAFTGKIEEGQGTRSALALLVAEELRVPLGSVRVVMGDTGVSPFDMGTFGSRSMPDAGPRLRQAAAAARRVLRESAAARFGMRAAALTAADGMIAGPDGAPAVSYAGLLAGARRVERARAGEELTAPADWRVAGHRALAAGAADVVTGRRRYPADMALAGMRHGCVLRPPAYGARLRTMDAAAAQALPDVLVVRDGDFTGVVAGDPRAARQAVAAISAQWDLSDQPGQDGLAAYLRSHPTSGSGWERPVELAQGGDVDAVLAEGPTRLTATYTTAYLAHVPLEPRSALARWESGRLTVWVGSSTPFRARRELAAALGVGEEQVEVIVPDVGGGFGGKHGASVALEAARLARAAGCPVKVAWSREEEFRWAYLRPAAVIDVDASVDSAGELAGWSFTNINSGAAGIATPYRTRATRIRYQPALSPLPQGSYRALAATANHFARESHIDDLARERGADPLAWRLAHLGDDRLHAVLRAAAEAAGWQTAAGGRPGGRGLGIACGVEKDGRVATAADVSVAGDGSLRVLRLVTAFECGAIVNPDALANQVEGAAVMALGGALFERVEFAGGVIGNASMASYRVPRLRDVPEVTAILLDRPDLPPAGGGETPMVAVAPAVANAIRAATGIRLRSMPLAPDGVVRG